MTFREEASAIEMETIAEITKILTVDLAIHFNIRLPEGETRDIAIDAYLDMEYGL